MKSKVARALLYQRDILERKAEHYAAVHRNFAILKEVSQRQKEDFKAAMKFAVTKERNLEQIEKQYSELSDLHHQVTGEVNRLRKKEEDMNFYLAKRKEMLYEIDMLKVANCKFEAHSQLLQATVQQLESDKTALKNHII